MAAKNNIGTCHSYQHFFSIFPAFSAVFKKRIRISGKAVATREERVTFISLGQPFRPE